MRHRTRKIPIRVRTALFGHMERVKNLQFETFPTDEPAELNIKYTIVALRGKQIIGFASADDCGFVHRYGVTKYDRNQGIGKRLIAALEILMAQLEFKRLYTYVLTNNPASLNVFIRCGWRAYMIDYAPRKECVYFEKRF